MPVAGGHRDTIIQVKAIALWSVLQHSRAMVVVVVVLYDEGCLTAVTSMNSSRGRVPALLNQHDGHHHAGRGGECAVVLGVFTARPHHRSGSQGTWLGDRQPLRAAAAAGPLPVAQGGGIFTYFCLKIVALSHRPKR